MGDFHELKIDSKRWYTIQVGKGAASAASQQSGLRVADGVPGPR